MENNISNDFLNEAIRQFASDQSWSDLFDLIIENLKFESLEKAVLIIDGLPKYLKNRIIQFLTSSYLKDILECN
jgi:hypothetical protein